MSLDPERELVERFRRDRDESAFRLLHRLHTPLLIGLARHLVGDAAEEVVQETWLRAARRLGEFRWESRLSTWLAGIAVNCCRSLRRDRAGLPLQPDAPGPLPALDQRLDLERALARLAGGYRAVVLLHDAFGYTHEEVGVILGVDPGTSKSQLSRARRLLRVYLAEGMEKTP